MAETETGRRDRQQTHSRLNLFLANTRSGKGKTTEIVALTQGFDIICLTETHIDHTIESKSILDTSHLDFFRRDRNIHGGGVLIAVKSCL